MTPEAASQSEQGFTVGVLGAKLLAVAFWSCLNAMVLCVTLIDDSELKRGIERGEPAAKVFIALEVLTGVLYLRAAFMNPGYVDQLPDKIPGVEDLSYGGSGSNDGSARRAPPPPPKDDLETGVGLNESGAEEPDTLGRQRDATMRSVSGERKVTVCGIPLWTYYKYMNDPEKANYAAHCNICEKGVPLRAKHCSSCDKCVSRYDHHCIWLGNCVGERNHGLFWWYLVCQSMVIIWGLYYVESAIRWNGFSKDALGAIEGFIWMNGLKIFIFFFIVIWSWLPVMLLLFHTYLLLTNQTTWEFNRRTRITYLRRLEPGTRPFDNGILSNLQLICCTPKLIDWQRHATMKLDASDMP